MNHSQSSGGGGAAVVLLLLALIVLAGLAGLGMVGGMVFWGMRSSPVMMAPPVATTAAVAMPTVTTVGEFPLTDRDTKRGTQSGAIAKTVNGSVVVAYVSQTAEDELSLFVTQESNGAMLPAAKVRTIKIDPKTEAPSLQPQLATTTGDKVVLGWVEPNVDGPANYYVAESQTHPLEYGDPLRVHESDGAQPTGIALATNASGDIVATWLDNRAGIRQPFAAIKKVGEEKFQPEVQVYASTNEEGVCPCSPTAVTIAPGGKVYVAFRNSIDGYRDIYVASRDLNADGEFSPAERVVSQPTWKFDGCPTDGPSLAADDNIVWVAWADASSGKSLVYGASKATGETSFTARPLEDAPADSPEEHVRIVLSGGNGLGIAAVWNQKFTTPTPTGSNSHIRYKPFTAPANQPSVYLGGATIMRMGDESRPSLVQITNGDTYIVYHQKDDRGTRMVVERHSP